MTSAPIGVAIVDDDPGFADTLADLLSLAPELIVVGTALTVAHGIALLADSRVQLGLVDVHMPDGGGLRVVEEVRSWKDAPTLALISADPPDAETHRAGVEFIDKRDLGLERLRRMAERARRR